MKKLKLKNLKLDANNILKRNQLKTLFGGYDGSCTTNCVSTTYSCPDGVSEVGILCTCNFNHSTLYNQFGQIACQ
ncbi:TIGR04149 family rSAM-modified RiPP [Flavivirga rizhaonensis]|uniref:RSAM-modified peptide n=1 Tax=Flavivirga rizhaonensis TaxID=2559571 RepID=A0A4S1DYQ9_9FLAO|nr:TIGR04149 family rSAM-modified RiPP [Flavivirga rizhaonensis]TGV03115.1 rSAM-modified peptide [Flavivirga rizhaonensis]